jgi:hypothetical protein
VVVAAAGVAPVVVVVAAAGVVVAAAGVVVAAAGVVVAAAGVALVVVEAAGVAPVLVVLAVPVVVGASVRVTLNWTENGHAPLPLGLEPVPLSVEEPSWTELAPLTLCSCTIVWATIDCDAAQPERVTVGAVAPVATGAAPAEDGVVVVGVVACSELSAAWAGIKPPI